MRVSIVVILIVFYLLARQKTFEKRYVFLLIVGLNVIFLQFFSPSKCLDIYYLLNTSNLLLLIPVIHVRRSKRISDIISQTQLLHLLLIFGYCFFYYGIFSGIAFQITQFGLPFFLHSIAIAFVGMVVCLRDSTSESYNKIMVFYYLMLLTDFLLTMLININSIDELILILNCVAYHFLIKGICVDAPEMKTTTKQSGFFS